MYKETRMSEVKITDGLIYKKRNIVKEKQSLISERH